MVEIGGVTIELELQLGVGAHATRSLRDRASSRARYKLSFLPAFNRRRYSARVLGICAAGASFDISLETIRGYEGYRGAGPSSSGGLHLPNLIHTATTKIISTLASK